MTADGKELGRQLLRYGASTLYWRQTLFDAAIDSLMQAGYRVYRIDCSSLQRFMDEMTVVLNFQENFGYSPWNGNPNALNDGFRYFEFNGATGIALAFWRFDLLLAEARWCAEAVLDILEDQSRDCLVAGHQLFGVVQSGDPKIALPLLGRRTPHWNGEEWLNKSRLPPEPDSG